MALSVWFVASGHLLLLLLPLLFSPQFCNANVDHHAWQNPVPGAERITEDSSDINSESFVFPTPSASSTFVDESSPSPASSLTSDSLAKERSKAAWIARLKMRKQRLQQQRQQHSNAVESSEPFFPPPSTSPSADKSSPSPSSSPTASSMTKANPKAARIARLKMMKQHRQQQRQQQQQANLKRNRNSQTNRKWTVKKPPESEDFECVFGFSTGHVGTTTLTTAKNFDADHVLFNFEGTPRKCYTRTGEEWSHY